MTVTVTVADASDREEWNGHLERSPYGGPFHRYEALQAQAKHAGATLHPLVGHVGQEPIGILPVFELRKGPITGAFSPPPYLHVFYLGPVLLNVDKLKVRKAERRHERFIDGCFEQVNERIGPQHVQVRTSDRHGDVRPFEWNGCTTTPWYTYVVDLTGGEKAVLAAFSSDARSNVRSPDDESYTIREGGTGTIERVIGQVRERYEAQGRSYGVPPDFVTELYSRLPDGRVRPYGLRIDGEFVGGMVVLEHGDTVYRWQGGVKPAADVDVPVNDLLDWRVMRDAMARGIERYDLVGAGNSRINRYKSKFGPNIATSYEIEGGDQAVNALVQLYKWGSAKIPS